MLLLEDTSEIDNVNLGAIFTLGTFNGKISKIAMETAVDDINSDPSILSDRNLTLEIHDSDYNGFLSVMGALQFMETDTVAIIGPQTSMMAHVLSHLANKLHVPLLSFTALDPTLSPIQYPYFFQTAPNDLFQMVAIAELVSYYRWTQVIAIFTDEEHSRNGITALGEKLTKKRAKISYKAILPPDIRGKLSIVKQELAKVKMMESRVLVVHTLPILGPIILKAAEDLGMIGNGYVWITTAWLSSILDCKTEPETYQITQGVMTLRSHTPDSPRKKAFIARWNNLSKDSTRLNVYGLYAYDTVWLIARAIDAFLRQGNNISFSNDPVLTAVGGGNMDLSALSIFDGGNELLKTILKTSMTGLTGPIRYNPDRVLVNPSFDVLNIVGSQMRRIGYWSNYSGLSILPPEILRKRPPNRSFASQKLYSVVWPGGTKKQPRGWVFPRDGRKLRIGVPQRVSFLNFVYQDNLTHAIHGYCIDVFEAAVKLLPYSVPYEFIFFGDGHQNPSYNELIKKITMGEFDAAVGDIAIITNRTMIVDFTQPYADLGLVVIAPVKKLVSSSWAFLGPFTPLMWAVTGVFFLVVGTVIWILEHRINDQFRGPPRQQLKTMLWFSFSTLFFAHRENTVSTLGRIVLAIWLFVVLIIQSSYTANLTSFLTVQQLSFSIKGIDSLITSNAQIGFQVGSYAENYLNEELNIHRSRLEALNSPEDYAEALKSGRVAAVVDEQPYANLFLSNYCQFAISGPQFTKSGWGFVFKRDSPLALDMSTALLELSENGSLQNMTRFWLQKEQGCQHSVNDSEQLKLDNFVGLFLVYGVACILALIIYFCLMLYKFHQYLPQQSEPLSQGSPHSARLKTFLSFAAKKEDLSQRRLKRKRMSASIPAYHTEMTEIE
ncbi:glutamate receptor 3.2 isoform X2 [Beta vulgaris subsp. vulgaris]|nr:glutamate receptor 3.2 isoform X2 [Beta vulgaris subsp. vulgaris]XP_048492196.1 glutamate receptor 3.2 isoform X2 [Beta vulgaris subsp. vulgaris]